MENQEIKQIIIQELPAILQRDREIQEFVLQLSRDRFADRKETASRFDRVLDELRREREEQSRRWREQSKQWEAQNKQWEAQDKKWEENQATINRMLQSIENLSRKHDSTIGALGARWGLYSEASFRNGLKGILEEFFDVQVLNVIEYDEHGEVFGRPDQIELDIIIKNGQLLICEIKSSMSRSEMYTFERKVRFYEKLHSRTADRMLVISPMVDKRAQAVADNLGIQVYSYAQDVDPELFD